MTKALINPAMLRWARERASLSLDHFAAKLKVKTDKLRSWEEGTDRPSLSQAEKIAKKTHVPLGYLFLSTPPKEELPIPDLRSYEGTPMDQPSTNFLDLIRDVQFQHDWYRDYLIEYGEGPLPFVGSYKLTNNVKDIASDIRANLRIDPLPKTNGWEDYLKILSNNCEKAGIRVMCSGTVGNNTHRTLDVHEFRGFAISDPIAPLLFINGRDAKAAQIFTLAHELAHIWLGESGVSNIRLNEDSPSNQYQVEQVCNAVAAEVLTPESEFLGRWKDGENVEDNIQTLAKTFKVSSVVVARRAFFLGKMRRDQYLAFYSKEQKQWKENRAEKDGGGNFYKTVPVKNGRKFTKAVLLSAMSGRLLLRDAGELLHMRPPLLQKLYIQHDKE